MDILTIDVVAVTLAHLSKRPLMVVQYSYSFHSGLDCCTPRAEDPHVDIPWAIFRISRRLGHNVCISSLSLDIHGMEVFRRYGICLRFPHLSNLGARSDLPIELQQGSEALSYV